MKIRKLLIVPAVLFLLVSTCYGAGSWTASTKDAVTAESYVRTLQLTFNADSGDATIPVYTFTAGDLGFTEGYYLYAVKTIPGATGPANGAWDVTIKDANSYEIMGNTADNRSSTAVETVFPKFDGTNYSYPPFLGTTTTVTIEGNAVNSATATILLFFAK